MNRERVVVGFSGGIDSATACSSLLEQGYDVVAVTLDTMGDKAMLSRAEESARRIGVPHVVLDVQVQFKEQIIDYFTRSYALGRTPAPCTMCNTLIKWHFLEQYADSIGAERISTGHYFNIEVEDGRYYVSRADDPKKDQSYYLWGVKQSQLRRALNPMGRRIKEEVKQSFADKSESMGVCFLAGASYREYLTQHCPEVVKSGEIVTLSGEVVGRHDGVAFYTIGQKRGLDTELKGIAIVDIDAESNRLIVGKNKDLFHATLEVEDCNIVSEDELLSSPDIQVVVRGIGRNPEGYIKSVEPTADGYRLRLENPAWAPAVGQPVVFYRGRRVIGGGVLKAFK